jgi:hypothetical protein
VGKDGPVRDFYSPAGTAGGDRRFTPIF